MTENLAVNGMETVGINGNSEILFIYDAKLTNPNGDPDEENRPRMDYATQTNLVSDVRLKRYIRDYLQSKGHTIFVTKADTIENKSMTATESIQQQAKIHDLTPEELPKLLDMFTDMRLFGATIAWQGKSSTGKKEGKSFNFTGPVQFSWGYSLNKVYLVDSSGITSHFSSGEKKQMGTMGRDYRVKYSLLAFYGVVSANRAKTTRMTERDLSTLDEALVKSIPLAATRSKIGQSPRFFLRVQYRDPYSLLGDFRTYVSCEPKGELKSEQVFSIKDLDISLEKLFQKLKANSSKIEKIIYFVDEEFPAAGPLKEIDFAEVQEITL